MIANTFSTIPHDSLSSRCATSFSDHRTAVWFLETYITLLLTTFVSISNLSSEIWPLITFFPVTTLLAHILFTITRCDAFDVPLSSKILQQYDTSSGMHLPSTSFQISQHTLSAHIHVEAFYTIRASRSIFILQSLSADSAVARTALFRWYRH